MKELESKLELAKQYIAEDAERESDSPEDSSLSIDKSVEAPAVEISLSSVKEDLTTLLHVFAQTGGTGELDLEKIQSELREMEQMLKESREGLSEALKPVVMVNEEVVEEEKRRHKKALGA